jgi:hypothetical protein
MIDWCSFSIPSAILRVISGLGLAVKSATRKRLHAAWLLLLFSASATTADQFDHLTPRVSGVSTALNAVAFGTSNYVAVGDGGVLLMTQDSLVWNKQPSAATNDLLGVAFGGGLFVGVGKGGTILTSSDGISWTVQTSGTTNSLRGAAFGSGTFVVVGDAGTILVSTNGVNWSIRITGVPYTLNSVVYGLADPHAVTHGFVAVGDSGTLLTSANGSAWTIRSSGTLLGLYGVALGVNPSGIDVVVGQSGIVVTSSDTITWTVQDSGTTANLHAIAVDPAGYYSSPILRNGPAGIFGAVGDGGAFLTSPDGGVTWTAQTTETTNNLRGIAFEDGGFLAVGDSGAIQAGFIWVKRFSGVTNNLICVIRGNDRFVAVGAVGTVVTSTDGANWQAGVSGTVDELRKVIQVGNRFVAVGYGGVVTTSTNGLNWNSQLVSGASNLTSIAYGNGIFLAVGNTGFQPFAFRSIDGTNWSPGTSLPAFLGDVGFGSNLFCAVGNGTIYTSTDGVQWSPQNSGFQYQMGGITYVNGEFVVAGQFLTDAGARMLTSGDGTNWTAHQSGYFSGVACSGHSAFVAAGGQSFIGGNPGNAYLTSSDGVNWTSRGAASISELPPSLSTVAFGGGTFVAVGAGGLITQSVPAPSLLNVRSVPQGMEVTVTGDIGRNFVLEAAPGPTTNSWTNLWSLGNAPYRTNFVDSVTNAPQRFYRSREL